MKSAELRAQARQSLLGKWGKGAILTFVFMLVYFCISYILEKLIPTIGPLAFSIIAPAFNFGFLVSLIKLSRDEEVTYFEFFQAGFSPFGKIWGIILHTILKMLLPFFIFIVGAITFSIGIVMSNSGIILIGTILYIIGCIYTVMKGFLYNLTSYILYDEPTLSAKEIVNKSENLMMGNRWRFFCLSFSFIGWCMLGVITLGIGYIWLIPYIQIAFVKFYEELKTSKTSTDSESPINDLH